MNVFNDIIYKQGKDGRIFQLHWKYRFGPLAIPLTIGGTILSAGGQIQAGQAQSAENKTAVNMAEYNAQVKDDEAAAIQRKTELEQRRQAEAGERAMGTLRAGLGGEGVISTAGSPLMIQAKQASELELENLGMGAEGITQRNQVRSEATGFRMQAKQYKSAAKSAKTASYIGAGSTLLTGFGSAGLLSGANAGYTGTRGFSAANRFGTSSSMLNFGQL
ncbi:MAG: hypothetical protein IMZ61_06530 [Planctomycetes bacterium]|nr:hypothetical protein [Planctomycetota bacterium]